MAIELTGPLYITGSISASAGIAGTAEFATSASYATTASYALNGGGGGLTPTYTVNYVNRTIDFTNVTEIGGNQFNTLYTMFTNAVSTTLGVTLTNVDNIINIGASAFNAHACLTGSITFPKLKSIGFSGFTTNQSSAGSFTTFIAPSCSVIGQGAFSANNRLVSASIGSATTLAFIGANCFQNCNALKYIYIPTLSGSLALGGTTANNAVFSITSTSGSITIPSFYSSSNAGAPDGDLAALIALGWTVTYV